MIKHLSFFRSFAALAIAMLSMPYGAYGKSAQLLLYPTRLVIENNEGLATVGLKNPGDATGNYRISLIDMDMKEEGAAIATKDEKIPYSAINMLRISPRKAVIEAGNSQNISLVVRKPKNLEDGEYRSHLQVTLIDDNVGADATSKEQPTTGVRVKPRFAIVIPIIIRHGKTHYDVKIIDAKLRYTTSEAGPKTPYADITFVRTGNRSSMGDIDVSYITPEGKTYVVKHIIGVPIYRSTERRKVVLPLDVPAGVTIGKGRLHVTYRAQESEGKKLLAESEFPL